MATYQVTLKDVDLDFQLINYMDKEIEDAELTIDFNVEIEARSWGIKGIYPVVTKCNGSAMIYDIETEEEAELIIDDSWTIEYEPGSLETITPQSASIEEKTKTITVEF